jgi:hypothetical protein
MQTGQTQTAQMQAAKSDASLAAMNFIEPGGIPIAAVQFPEQAYPGSDFASASFGVSVNQTLDALRCAQFSSPAGSREVPQEAIPASSREKASEARMEEEDVSAGDTQAKYYHLFTGGSCYEFQLAVRTLPEAAAIGRVPVNRDQVFSRLQKILASVTILGRRAMAGE